VASGERPVMTNDLNDLGADVWCKDRCRDRGMSNITEHFPDVVEQRREDDVIILSCSLSTSRNLQGVHELADLPAVADVVERSE